jgi:hypothetical protein
MSLKQKISGDLKEAIKSKNEMRRDTLRMLNSAIKNVEIEKKKKEQGLSDEETREVVARAIKQRKDSIAQYEAGGRKDLSDKEKQEMEILSGYLPKQMDEDEIKSAVKKIIFQAKASSAADMGRVMGIVMRELKGKADGQLVRKIVEAELK